MTADETDHGANPAHDDDSGADVGHDVGEGRTTAPMSAYTTDDVGIGFAVLAVGLLVAFVLPIVLTL